VTFLDQITVLILTFDEAPNIGRTLDALDGFSDIVVLDSHSRDATVEIASRYPGVRVATRPFDTHAEQWNHALAQCTEREWVLALDADYVLTDALVKEMASLSPGEAICGYRIHFNYCVYGRRLSGALYTPVLALYRRQAAHYVQDGHTQRAVVSGDVLRLNGRIDHDDRKPLERWLSSQARYAMLEADSLLRTPWSKLKMSQRIRRLVLIAPWLVPLYCLTVCRGIFDGWAGLFYAFQRGIAESILAIRLLELKVRRAEQLDDKRPVRPQ
jgi:glycosyltransferase involved in cell wall biosynthesis